MMTEQIEEAREEPEEENERWFWVITAIKSNCRKRTRRAGLLATAKWKTAYSYRDRCFRVRRGQKSEIRVGWWELSVRKKCWLTESNMTGRVRPKNTLSSLSQPIVIADWPGLGASRADWPRRRLLSFHSRAHWHTHTPFYNHCENKFFFWDWTEKIVKLE